MPKGFIFEFSPSEAMISQIFVNENYLTVEIDASGIFNFGTFIEEKLTEHEEFKLVPIFGGDALHQKDFAKIHPPVNYLKYYLSFTLFKTDFSKHFHLMCVDEKGHGVPITPAVFEKIFTKFKNFQENAPLRKKIKDRILTLKRITGKPTDFTPDELARKFDLSRQIFPSEELSLLEVSFSKHYSLYNTPSEYIMGIEELGSLPGGPSENSMLAPALPSPYQNVGMSITYGTMLLATVAVTFFASKCIRKNRNQPNSTTNLNRRL